MTQLPALRFKGCHYPLPIDSLRSVREDGEVSKTIFIRCRELARQFPYLALCAIGFGVMTVPVAFWGSWALFAWMLAEGPPIPLAVETFFVRYLSAIVSLPAKIFGWTVFACGFVLMNVGWLLHCRERTRRQRPPISN
jgi:hypothetical protein